VRKAFLLVVALILSLFVPVPAGADDVVKKNFCMTAIGYPSTPDNLKRELLAGAQRMAVGELFGELISSYTKVENFTLSEDRIQASSAGLVRVKGDPLYSNGRNFGDVCVQIEAYVTEEDREKFKPLKIGRKHCTSEKKLSVSEMMTYAKEETLVKALVNYDRNLEGLPWKHLLPLVHNVQYTESGFIPDTDTYCVRFTGTIYPIEILSVSQNRENLLPVEPLVAGLPPGAFSASSVWANNHVGYRPQNARLNDTSKEANWSAAANNKDQWIQVDLGSIVKVKAVATQGRHSWDQWVTAYRIGYSLDGRNWSFYRQDGRDVMFDGNRDRNTTVRHDLTDPFPARYVRFYPDSWHGHISMRFDVYGVRME